MQKTWLNLDFFHKSFQELFAAFFICAQIQSKEIRPDELVSDPRYFVKLEEILFFCGILAIKCNEQVVALVMSLTNEVNENESSSLKVVLEAINECKRQKSDFHSRFDQSGFVWQWYEWSRRYIYCWGNQIQQDANQFEFV